MSGCPGRLEISSGDPGAGDRISVVSIVQNRVVRSGSRRFRIFFKHLERYLETLE
jgi:hypothetical protein